MAKLNNASIITLLIVCLLVCLYLSLCARACVLACVRVCVSVCVSVCMCMCVWTNYVMDGDTKSVINVNVIISIQTTKYERFTRQPKIKTSRFVFVYI